MATHTKRRAPPRRQVQTPIDPNAPPMLGTRRQLAELHSRLFGPMSARTLERLPLPSRIVGRRAMYDVQSFLAWAEQRIAAAPVIAGRRSGRAEPPGANGGVDAAR